MLNNKVIKKLKKHSFLTCVKKTVPFYLKYNWKILPKNRYTIVDHVPTWFKSSKEIYGMTFNLNVVKVIISNGS